MLLRVAASVPRLGALAGALPVEDLFSRLQLAYNASNPLWTRLAADLACHSMHSNEQL